MSDREKIDERRKRPAALDGLTLASASELVKLYEAPPKAATSQAPLSAQAPLYARECLITLIDAATNYREVVIPRPSYAPRPTDLRFDPRFEHLLLLRTGYTEGWLTGKEGDPASKVEMTNDQLREEYDHFKAILRLSDQETRRRISEWSKCELVPSDLQEYDHNFPAEDFFDHHPDNRPEMRAHLERSTGLDQLARRNLFSLFARTYQYDVILNGEAEYVPHRFRQGTFASKISGVPTGSGVRWSWGRYFVWLLDKKRWPWSSVEKHISMVREACFKQAATWNDWPENPTTDEVMAQKRKITDIAMEYSLPARLDEDIQSHITTAFAVATGAGSIIGALAGSHIPGLGPVPGSAIGAAIVTMSLKVGTIALGPALGRDVHPVDVPLVRRLFEWPGLFEDTTSAHVVR